MLADYFTKPVQGKKFRTFGDCIMGTLVNDSSLKLLEQVDIKSLRPEEILEFVYVIGKTFVIFPRTRSAEVCWISKNQWKLFSLW